MTSLWTRLIGVLLLAASAAPALAQLTPVEVADQMGRGINLGNTMEPPTEGAWNNGPVQEHYFDDYVAAGFSTVRLPVRWDQHMSQTAPFTINGQWLNRVEQVVDWGLERGLFIILNSHHDDWLKRDYSNPRLQARFDSLWSQVAARFQDKSDRLLFEMFNEPFDPMTLADTEDMNARVLPIIRRTNPTRIVLYSGASFSSRPQLIAAEVPDDPYVMGYYHSYDPFLFGLRGQGTWGTDADRRELEQAFESVAAWSASTGVPAVLSEFGAIRPELRGTEGRTVVGEADYNSRMRFYGAFVAGALEAGIPFQAWDDGGDFRIYQRQERDWNDIKDILVATFPDGPRRFAVAVADDTVATLTWDAPGGRNTGLTVQRRTGDEAYATVAELAPGLTTHTDTIRTGPGDYTYRVVAHQAASADMISYPQRVTVLPFSRSPWGGAPVALPGVFEAEDYDIGGEGLTYHDSDAVNITGAYRPEEGVDIEARSDGGFHIAYVEPEEWTEYTVTVAQTGLYNVTAYVASLEGGGTFRLSSGRARATFSVPRTGDWETLAAVTERMRLSEGEQVVRFTVAPGSEPPFNLDRVAVAPMATSTEDGLEAEALRVFPNPARSSVTVGGVEPGPGRRVEVYDALGKRVLESELLPDLVLEVGDLAAGTYLVRVSEGGETVARRSFVVVR